MKTGASMWKLTRGTRSLTLWTRCSWSAGGGGLAPLELSGHLTNPSVSLLSLQSPIVSLYPLNSSSLSLSLILPLMMMPKVVFENLGKIVRFCSSALYSPSWKYKSFSVLYYRCLRWRFVNITYLYIIVKVILYYIWINLWNSLAGSNLHAN